MTRMSPGRRARGLFWPAVLLCVSLAVAAGCEKPEFEPPSREERVAEAETLLTPETFDTLAWNDAAARVAAGNAVYAEKCRRCHGFLGGGDTEFARQQGLDVPSLVAPDWEYAGDLDAVRHRIFVGHPGGMPTWGVAGITSREIDAAAFYILEQLRPEVLGERDTNRLDSRPES